MNKEKYKKLIETLPKESEKLWFEYNLEVNKILQENQELKKQLENKNKQIEYLRRSIERKEDTIIDLQNETIPYTNEYVCKLETQQKEFIEYLEKTIIDSKAGSGQQYYYQQVLEMYKEIIGGKDDR